MVTVNVSGDGIDSNGDIEVTGGELYISGPTSNGDGAIDCDGSATITGGIVVAAGSTGMAGNLLAETVCKVFHITDPIAKGVGIGTSAHAVGTSKALQMGEVEGAMSGLSIAVAGVLTAVLCPVFVNFIN